MMFGRLAICLTVLVMILVPAGAAEVAVEQYDLFASYGGFDGPYTVVLEP